MVAPQGQPYFIILGIFIVQTMLTIKYEIQIVYKTKEPDSVF